MAPVVITWNNSVAGYFTAARAAGETWVRINDALTAWVAGIGEPDTISVLETYAQTVSTDEYSYCLLGVHKNVDLGIFQYGFGVYSFAGSTPLINVDTPFNMPGTSLNNGHRRGGLSYSTSALINATKGVTASAMTIVYCTDPGNQYFHFMDATSLGSFTLARLVRPPASTYPSTAQAAEFVYNASGTAQFRTFSNGFATVNVPWTTSSNNYPIQPLDPSYIFAGSPIFSRSLYMGNLPPGVGIANNSTPFASITTVGSETWITAANGISVRRSV